MFFNFCVRGLSTRLEGREKEGKKKLKRLPSTLPLNYVPSRAFAFCVEFNSVPDKQVEG